MQVSSLKKKPTLEILMAGILLLVSIAIAIGINLNLGQGGFLNKKTKSQTPAPSSDKNSAPSGPATDFSKFLIAIDAGHGGVDPGKVGINKQLEKDINLSIAKKLEQTLLSDGFQVIMTRHEDVGLYAENDSNKKRTDMKKRVQLINQANATLCISIHQNSFTSEKATGAQVFYYSKSDKGKQLAACIQRELIAQVDPSNSRTEKSNHNYYMLLNVACPSVIVECGFLSNWREATNLSDSYYQDKIANAVTDAIKSYITSLSHNKILP